MKSNWIKQLGPGLLFAGAAIGVSHLVQSTRAGADFGFGLLWAVLLVNLFKYPFFQYGARYATATGESLIDGYKRLGNVFLIIYFLLTFTTMFSIQAAITMVTGGLAANLFGITLDAKVWSVLITVVCLISLLIGKYKLLDKLIKVIIVILSVSTIAAVTMAIYKTEPSNFTQIFPKSAIEISFLIAFLGWMPAPLDVSTWHSLWAIEKRKNLPENYTTKQSLLDFNIGYIGTTILAICFIALGALVMYKSGNQFSSNSGKFAQQLILLYTETLGPKTSIFIAIAAFTTMFSTALTALDASPRAMAKSSELLFSKKTKLNYNFWILLLAAGTIIILFYFVSNMITMVKIATILSFLTTPFYAIANLMLISGEHTPKKWHPSKAMKVLSYSGIVFLIGFSLWYLFNLL
ncbi:divalent metal cation transporter [Aureibaculum marinum]|uniref:Divalent metal cation transporter n=1 Tax=Aureibaculum marinum TaxID=2487930 RepID=A0A3N4P4P0_9FLAO|nr:Nramp family divalent metal transporter [Aureibaculum marinum]RPD99550.1 divalent metal cation transporter [Aureibaculum marinum]